jgi:hypothetical protein
MQSLDRNYKRNNISNIGITYNHVILQKNAFIKVIRNEKYF